MKKNYHWTKREDRVLRDLYPAGGWLAVAKYLPLRTIGGVRARLKSLNIVRHFGDTKNDSVSKPAPEKIYEVKTRACLRCLHKFESSWPGERICQTCKRLPSWSSGMSDIISRGHQVRPRGAGSD